MTRTVAHSNLLWVRQTLMKIWTDLHWSIFLSMPDLYSLTVFKYFVEWCRELYMRNVFDKYVRLSLIRNCCGICIHTLNTWFLFTTVRRSNDEHFLNSNSCPEKKNYLTYSHETWHIFGSWSLLQVWKILRLYLW